MVARVAGSACRPDSARFGRAFFLFLICLLVPAYRADSAEQSTISTSKSFIVEGNTLLPGKKILDLLQQYKGPDKTAEDVEKARDALEKVYHDAGYPAVLVNIPEQQVQAGRIHLQVIESKIGNVRVRGTGGTRRKRSVGDLPSLAPGQGPLCADGAEGPGADQPGPGLQGIPRPFPR